MNSCADAPADDVTRRKREGATRELPRGSPSRGSTAREPTGAAPDPPGWRILSAVSLCVGAGVLGAVQLARGDFVTGGLMLALSVAVSRSEPSMWAGDLGAGPSGRKLALAVLAVCATAVFFRTYRLEPPGLWGDDAINGLLAFDVLDGKIHSPFELVRHSHSYFHALTNYIIAGFFWALGAGPVTLRLPGIIAGILAVPLLYATTAPLFGSRVALVSALFFASSPMQVCHSKVLAQVVFGLFFQLLGMSLLVRGVYGGRRWLAWIAGAPLALCLYTYHSARLAPLLAIFWVAALALRQWRQQRSPAGPTPAIAAVRRIRAGDVVPTTAVFLLFAGPAIISYLRSPAALTKRMGEVALWPALQNTGSLWPLWDSVWRTLMIFPYEQGPVRYHWFGLGTEPALNVIMVFLLAHGLVQSLRRVNEPRHLLLLAWAFIGLLPGMLSTEAPRGYRVLQATPPLFVWAGLALVRLHAWATGSRAPRSFARGIAIGLVAAVFVLDFNQYFYRFYTSSLFRDFQAEPIVAAARELRRRGPGWSGEIIAPRFRARYESLAFLARAWNPELSDVTSLADALPIRREANGGVLFAVYRGAEGALELLRAFYPSVREVVHEAPEPRSWWFDSWAPLFRLEGRPTPPVVFFPVPRREIEARRGLTATYWDGRGQPVAIRPVAGLSMRHRSDPRTTQAAVNRVTWQGSLYAPVNGSYRFELLVDGTGTVLLDGTPVVSSTRRTGSLGLAQGLHEILAEAALPETSDFELRWQPPGQQLQTIPPPLLFDNPQVHGLSAEYEGQGRILSRIEPFPYYQFFLPTFANSFSVRWDGRVDVPEPGGYRLRVTAAGRALVRVDGQPWNGSDRLSAGTHELEMRIVGISGAPRLELSWIRPDGRQELIPPHAFSPPRPKTGKEGSSGSDQME